MEDSQLEDEKKPFDAEHAQNEEETQPDPDESLMMDAGNGRVWLVKVCVQFSRFMLPFICSQVPKFLMERWTNIDADGVDLATIRVYKDAKSTMTGRPPRIVLILPPNPETPTIPGDEYEMDMVNESVENQIIVAEREKFPGTASRARTTILTGRVKHECNLRPVFTDRYRQRLRERARAANTSSRTIQYIENAHPGGRGGINMLTSGVANASGFSDLVVSKSTSTALPVLNHFDRGPKQSRQKGSSREWRVCLATSCSICCLACSEKRNTGPSNNFENERSNLRFTLKKSWARLHSFIAQENITELGN